MVTRNILNDETARPGIIDIPPAADPLELARYELNDYGMGRRLVALAQDRLRFVDGIGWVAYDGKRWSARDGDMAARRCAVDVAGHIRIEAKALTELAGSSDDPDEAALRKQYGEWCTPRWAKRQIKDLHNAAVWAGNYSRTLAMLKQAESMDELRARLEDFDQDPLAINLLNGTLRFVERKGRWRTDFRPHDPVDMLMQLANVEYDPEAQCPQWLDRLALVQPDPDVRTIFPRMYGQTLTGLTDCEEFYVHKGRGGDGKTKTHEIIADLLGDYYRHSSTKTFLTPRIQKSGSEHRSDLVRLRGDVRFVLCDEPPPRSIWDGETLKQATGGGYITARGSGEKSEITFRPRFKLFIEVNPLPDMPSDDKGFRRRFRLILWEVDLARVPGGFEPADRLRRRLLAEKSGILNWMIGGCLEWLGDRRVPVPDVEKVATADFWAQASPLGEWLDDQCDLSDRSAMTGTSVLHQDFKDWCQRNDIDPERWTMTKFGRELTQRQLIGTKDARGTRVRKGIRLKSAMPLNLDPASDPFAPEEDY